MADPVALRDRVLALVAPELELLDLDLVEFEVLGGGRRLTLRFSLEKLVEPGAIDPETGSMAVVDEEARRVSIDECARASRSISRVIEAEEAEKGEFLGRYTIEVTSPGIFRRLRRPEDFVRFVGEIVKVSYEEEGKTLQARGRIRTADAHHVVVESEERGALELHWADISRANLDPDLDFGRKGGR